MNEQKILNFLGIAQRANQIISGQELVLKAIKKQHAKFVFIASDTGNVAQKDFLLALERQQIAYTDYFSQIQLSSAIGRSTKSIAIMDIGFAQRFRELIND
ncbi:L7Ae/L30e/S12e/Gadd45 family ribosomal protein [Bombilactobacillus thymidiniphilus]|uniref:Ribosomal L7Ae/L30e/S12e/Gadd45 family protein n=1 Tax=Bombilactobacillus thymidiniphilus TaxID=2923363 RepID=A0ABY4PCV3_9LACO|nr:ribosomal L7Ae/L30e/S12e/Gadd45 family protein [Bombilactobacillus thymidiniphilus]UQS83498.1 ribosomal L7Ae/L30e/S12e/Gadd45 family protein [Bombilactobacillus thymidiniphilus]